MTETAAYTRMYYMKPVFSLPERLPQTEVMYEMKKCHNHCRITSTIEQQAPHPEFAALESRQEKILGQLAELKKMIARLSDMVKNTSEIETATVVKEEIKKDPVTMDIVVKVDRSQIPYSLLALQTIWQDTHFNISCHSHSEKYSCKSTDITHFEKIIQANKQTENSTNGLNVVNLILIWKNTDILEINMGLPNKHLLGESTLLRLLSRTILSHNYEDQISTEQLSLIDRILDYCYQASMIKNDISLNNFIMELDNTLKSENTWIVNKSEPSIADIAAWSVIKSQSTNKLPNNVAKWFDKCQKQFCC